MKTIEEFCKLLKFDSKTAEEIIDLEKKVLHLLGDKILSLAKLTMQDGLTDSEFQAILKTAQSYGKEIREHEFKMQMIFAYYCFALLEEKYERAKIDKTVYEDTIQDFRFRVYECQEVYGFTGIFVAWWYLIFCNLSLQKLGELEFEKKTADFDYDKNGVTVKKGDKIIAIHIPPKFKMNRETVTKALKESYKFYGFSGKVAYECSSWLLYPDFEKVFVSGGNVSEFRTFFDVISKTDNESFEDCWRVFKVGKIEDLSVLPTQTRLQRNMLEHLKAGKKTGDGFGVLVFDGEKIL